MTAASSTGKRKVPLLVWVLVPAALLLFAGANAHLVYVAFQSQPGCVHHLKNNGPGSGDFRAAKAAC